MGAEGVGSVALPLSLARFSADLLALALLFVALVPQPHQALVFD